MDINNLTSDDIDEIRSTGIWEDVFLEFCPICNDFTVQMQNNTETENGRIYFNQCTRCKMIIDIDFEREHKEEY